MVNFKINPESPIEVYKVCNVRATKIEGMGLEGNDWKPLPKPVHFKVMNDIDKNILILDGPNPYKDVKFPRMPGIKYPLPGEKKEEVIEEPKIEKEENSLLNETVKSILEKLDIITDRDLLQNLLDEEKNNKNRKTLITFLEEKIWYE